MDSNELDSDHLKVLSALTTGKKHFAALMAATELHGDDLLSVLTALQKGRLVRTGLGLKYSITKRGRQAYSNASH